MADGNRRILAGLAAAACAAAGAAALASEFDPLKELHDRERVVTAPWTASPPRIDGAISPGEWDCAAALTGFHSATEGSVLPDGPVLFVAYGEKEVFVLAVTPQDSSRPLSARVKDRDIGELVSDDSIEIFLSPDLKNVFQFITNPAGVTADLKNDSLHWDGEFAAAAGEADASALSAEWGLAPGKYWFAEFAIPYETVEARRPAPGERWSINAAVNRAGPWAALNERRDKLFSHIPDHAALIFLAPGDPYIQLTALGAFHFGEPAPAGRAFNPGDAPARIHLDLDMRKEGSRTTEDAYRTIIGAIKSFSTVLEVPPSSSRPFRFPNEARDTAIDRLAVRLAVAGEDGKPARDLVLRRGRVQVLPPLVVRIGNVPSRRYSVLSADTSGLKSRMDGRAVAVRAAILDAEGKELLAREAAGPAGEHELRLDWSNLAPGEYRCAVRALSGQGKELALAEASLRVPDKPEWLTSTIYDDYGKTDRVPLPWRPVRMEGRTLEVWGRTVTWEPGSILPSKIKSLGTHLLAEPMKLAVSAGGREFTIPMDSFRITGQNRKRVTFVAEGRARGIRVRADMFAEFDGFVWVQLSVTDEVKGRKVDSMRVLARMDAAQTTLYQTFTRKLAGAIPGYPVRIAWQPLPNESIVNFYHWLGNEDRGLGFTFTSLQHWEPRSEDNFATIIPGKDRHTYAINLIERPSSVDGRHFTFGIQATPIKPLPPDWHGMVASSKHWQPWRFTNQKPEWVDIELVWPEPMTTIMLGLNNPYNVDSRQYQEQLKHSHERGVSLVTVAACPQKISYHDQWVRDFDLEWKNLPESVLNWNGVPTWQNCGRSYTLRKWLFYGWAVENVQKLGTDGIYFDGWQAGQMGCSNPHHGCGWVDAEGRRHLTVPVLEGREFNQRMCLFLEDHVRAPHFLAEGAPARPGFPRYHYWIHSWEFVPPVMGYATEWLTGEFTGYPQRGTSTFDPAGSFADCLGLDVFRTRGLSTCYGVTNMWLPMIWEDEEELKRDHQTVMALAWFLPHGVPIGGASYLNRQTLMEVTGILYDYRHRHAAFTPGWRPNPFWKIESPRLREVMVATWKTKDQDRVLAVVSNLQLKKEARVTLRWTGFAGARFVNPRTGEQLTLENGRLTVTLKPETFILIGADKDASAGKREGQ